MSKLAQIYNINDVMSESEDELEIVLATSLSLSEYEEKQNEEEILEENEDFQLALAVSKADQEEKDRASQLSSVGVQQNQELVNRGLAIALSEEDLENQEEDVLVTEYFLNLQLEDWMSNGREMFSPRTREKEKDSDSGLPEVYKNYRLVSTMFSDQHMWPPGAICQQQSELRLGGGTEQIQEWQEGQCESERCLVCWTNVATRVAVPCGHKLCCRTCVSELVDKSLFYSVTSPSGQVCSTDWRLPVQCFVCRAIVGQIITLH